MFVRCQPGRGHCTGQTDEQLNFQCGARDGQLLFQKRAAASFSFQMHKQSERINLGLAIMAAVARPGHQYSYAEIAAFCDCRIQTIINIERNALRKLKHALKRANMTQVDAEPCTGA